MAIGVLAGTVAVLAGLAAFQTRRSVPSAAPRVAPVRGGLFAAEASLPAAFRFEGASGRFTPMDAGQPLPRAAWDASSLPAMSSLPAVSGLRSAFVGRASVRDEVRVTQPIETAFPATDVPVSSAVPVSPGVPVARPGWRGAVSLPRTRRGRRLLVVGVAGVSALGGLVAAGPVGMLVAVYCRLAVRGLLRRDAARAELLARNRTLDMLCTLAADLRAGLPHTDPPALPDPRIGRLTTAAWLLAERTGAPLADLVERIESDTRVMARGQAAAAAEAAGARVTAWLLAGLPIGGLALGAFMGVNPLDVLLHTPIGAACAVGAVVLQSAGLAWANRLASPGGTS